MGIRCREAGQPMGVCELCGARVAVADHQSRVPGLDIVERRNEPLELVLPALAPGAGPKAVERVGETDYAALLANGLGGLVRRETGRDRLLDVERNKVAR